MTIVTVVLVLVVAWLLEPVIKRHVSNGYLLSLCSVLAAIILLYFIALILSDVIFALFPGDPRSFGMISGTFMGKIIANGLFPALPLKLIWTFFHPRQKSETDG